MVEPKQIDELKRFKFLLFFLLIYIFGSPFITPFTTISILVHISLTVVLFVSIYTIKRQGKERMVAMAMFIPLLFLYWLGIYEIVPFSRMGSYLFFVFYFGFLVFAYVR